MREISFKRWVVLVVALVLLIAGCATQPKPEGPLVKALKAKPSKDPAAHPWQGTNWLPNRPGTREFLAGKTTPGFLIRNLMPGSPADKVGVRGGDVIVQVNQETITSSTQYDKLLRSSQPGDAFALKVVRNGKELSVDLVLGNYQDALALIKSNIRSDPKNAEHHLMLGKHYGWLKHYDKSISALEEAKRLNPNETEAWLVHGYIYEMQKQFSKALPEYKRALEIDPRHPVSHRRIGWTYYKLKDPALGPAAVVHTLKARLLYQEQNYPHFIKATDRALKKMFQKYGFTEADWDHVTLSTPNPEPQI